MVSPATHLAHQFELAQADTFLYQKNFGEALKRYAAVLDASNLPEERMNILNKYIEAGIEAIQESNQNKDIYGSAVLDKAKEAVVLLPTAWGAHFRFGRVLKSLNKKEEALEALSKALELDPTQDCVRIVRDELAFPVKPRDQNLLPTFAEELEDAANISGSRLTKESAMAFAKIVSGSENPNLVGLEDLIKGHQYRDGDGVVKDLRRAFDHYKLSADKGNPEGMYNLALAYLRGESVEKNFTKAFELLHIVLTAPDFIKGTPCPAVSCAYYTLGWLHYNGTGVQRDLCKAFDYYNKASENGHASAAFQLGNMYASGEVSRDSEKAVQYWKLAATRGTPEGMVALAFHFLEQGDFKMSNDWYEKARLTRYVTPDIEKKYKELRQKMKVSNERLKELERKKKFKSNGNSGGNFSDRIKRVTDPYGDLVTSMMERVEFEPHPMSIKTYLKYNPDVVQRFASQGHIFAQRVYIAQTHFFKSFSLLPVAVLDRTGNSKADFVRQFAKGLRTADFVCEMSPDQMTDMKKVVKEVLNKGDDKDATLCWIFLNMSVPMDMKKMVEISLKKYPEEPVFYHFMCSIHGFLQQFDQGAKIGTDALKLFPDDTDLLFDAGEHYRLADRFSEAVVHLKKFLEIAPKDHRKYPELCYNLAGVILGYGKTVSEATITEAKKYYLLGQESEKLLMPFFRPCDELPKKIVKCLLDKFESSASKSGKKKKSGQKNSRENCVAPTLSKCRLSDPYRIQIVKSHREMALKNKSISASVRPGNTVVAFPFTAPTAKTQKAPKVFEDCKRMYLQEMETSDDKVFVGRFVTVTVIEDPYEIVSLDLIVEDEKGTPQRAALYQPASLKDRPVFGAKIRLYNPFYRRMALDGAPTLRMEDPKSVVLESIDPSLCRSCCSPGAGFTCAKCKKAKYCNRECQANDWKNFGHKLICD